MRTMRYLAGRLPWLVLGLGIGAVAVWLGRERTESAGPAPPEPAPVSIAPAPRAVPVTDDPERARRVGAALARIKPGMTRREVEAVLGPPDLERWQQFTVRWIPGPAGRLVHTEVPYVVYYCSPPHMPPGSHMMTVEYEGKSLAPITPKAKVISVSGPHTLENCG